MIKQDRILLAHGSGGKLSADLISSIFAPAFANPALAALDDSAVLEEVISHQSSVVTHHSSPITRHSSRPSVLGPQSSLLGRLAITTDSHVVKPLFFDGGDIGRLAVCGTVNDLAMVGARPLYLTAGFVVEEGLELSTLKAVVASMKAAAEEAGVQIVAGDTKVVEKGSVDELFITTSGVGIVPTGVDISGRNAHPGDAVILSGPIADHGIAVMSKREGLRFESPVSSDVAPLNGLVQAMLRASDGVRALRDPTRGGLATSLNEFAAASRCTIQIDEGAIPVRPAVQAACELLGYDPLYVANEGKLVAIVAPDKAERVLEAMHEAPYGTEARIIGRVLDDAAGKVVLKTRVGGTRIVQMLMGEMLPRIC